MKENTPVAVLTVGSSRTVAFHRKYEEDGKTIEENDPCYLFEQSEGSLFVLHPDDEVPKQQRNCFGVRKDKALFVHGVTTTHEKDYFSVAFVFRCLETKAVVNATTDRVIAGDSLTEKEARRHQQRSLIRERDSKPNSEFKKKQQKCKKNGDD